MDEKKSLDELLVKKQVSEDKDNKDPNSTEALKKRMQKVINASKKLDNDLEEDPKKVAMRQKLARAAKEAEEEAKELEELENSESKEQVDDDLSMEDEIAAKKAKYYAEKNAKAKAKLDSMEARLNEVEKTKVVNDTPFKSKSKTEVVEPVSIVEVEQEPVVIEKVEPQPQQQTTVNDAPTNNEELANHIVSNIVEQEKEEVIEEKVEEVSPVEEEKVTLNLEEVKVSKKPSFFVKLLGLFKKSLYGLGLAVLFSTLLPVLMPLLNTQNSTIDTVLWITFTALNQLCGAAIGLCIGYLLDLKKAKLLSLAIAGEIGYFMVIFTSMKYHLMALVVAYLVVIICTTLMSVLFKKDSVLDYTVLPLLSIVLSAALAAILVKALGFLNSLESAMGSLNVYVVPGIFILLALVLTLVSLIVKKAKK